MAPPALPPDARVVAVHLQVRDLDRSLAFYRDLLGFREVARRGSRAFLSPTGRPPSPIVLTARPDALPRPRGTTGLYHVAIRFPDRTALAAAFRRLLEGGWPLQGASDHGVSEAIYLADPDGNGIELCRDRPPERWPRRQGRLAMTTVPLDLEALLAEAPEEGEDRLPPEVGIGHVHLQVADLEAAEAFYADLLGLEVTQRDYPGARFFAAGGYHHHLGVNVWAGRRAPRPPSKGAGLKAFLLHVPDPQAVAELSRRLGEAGRLKAAGPGWAVAEDGSGNRVQIAATWEDGWVVRGEG